MKKILLLFFISIFSVNLFAMTSSNYDDEGGQLLFFSLSYANIFNSSNKIFTLNILEFSMISSPAGSFHIGYITQFSQNINVFDIYIGAGVTLYPFKKIFSVSGNFYYGLSLFTLNHFSYIIDLKTNIDIPIYKIHNLSFGAGLRHRNAIKIIGLVREPGWFPNKSSIFSG
jgi:hypothetical protein